jgi:phospholipase/lecithinase/hemolysin
VRLRVERLEERSLLTGSLVGNLVVFGDSLSDTGNASLATGGTIPNSTLYSQGRFSNGPIWVDTLAKYLGTAPVQPSLAGGLDYAFGGATVAAPEVPPLTGVPTLGQQVQEYLGPPSSPLHKPAANDLFAVWAGANDFIDSFSSMGGPISPLQSADTVVSSLQTLATAGARQFVVANLPPLGDTPFFSGLGLGTAANLWATAFDGELSTDLGNFKAANPGVTVAQVDVAGLFGQALQPSNPFGFVNTTAAVGPLVPGSVFLSSITATDPQDYLFFDGVHPTSKASQLIGLEAAASVFDALNVHHLVVTSTADTIKPLTPGLSLREALNLSNAMTGQQTITFDLGPGHQITLSGTDLRITQNVNILGPGANRLTISGNSASRVFDIGNGATVTLSGLTIANGSVTADESGPLSLGGGGILNEAGSTLTLDHCTVSNNTATAVSNRVDIFGGGLLNEGTATVTSCTFSGDKALDGGGTSFFGGSVGGGIDNYGGATLTVTGSTFTGNQALGNGTYTQTLGGGGINGTFSFGIGGAIENNAGESVSSPSTATIDNCVFTGNLAGGDGDVLGVDVGGNGGAIDNEGPGAIMTLRNSTVRGNQSGLSTAAYSIGLGGGLFTQVGSTTTVVDSTISDNVAVAGPGEYANGGGIVVGGATMYLINSAVDGNQSIGGAGGSGIGTAVGEGIGGGIVTSGPGGCCSPWTARSPTTRRSGAPMGPLPLRTRYSRSAPPWAAASRTSLAQRSPCWTARSAVTSPGGARATSASAAAPWVAASRTNRPR